MLTKDFIDFIKYRKVNSINDLFSYALNEKVMDILIYYCKKYQVNIPKYYILIHNNYKIISRKRFQYLINCFDEMNNNNINYYIIKGPVSSKFLYDDLFERWYSDIDIIVSTKDYVKMHNILIKNKFKNALMNDNISNSSEARFAFNIRGEDIIYSKSINNFEVGFEIRDKIRLLDYNHMKIINKHIEQSVFDDIKFNHLNLEYVFLLQIVYAYNAYFTEYGLINNYKIKYLIELYILFEKYKNVKISKLSSLFESLNLTYMFDKVMLYYNLIFKNYNIIEKNNKMCNIFQMFDDSATRLKNYYISLFNQVQTKVVKSFFELKSFKNSGENKVSIIRSFTKKNKQNFFYFTYDIFSNDEFVTFFISFPRTLDDITFQIILLNNSNYQYEIELTFYKDFINEYRSNIPFNYTFNYFDKKWKCFIFKIDKKLFNSYVSSKEFLFKILLRKIWMNKYPLMSFEHSEYTKFIFN